MGRDLTKGNINKNLIKLALPIMGTSFLQMTYNLTDVFWVGHLGDESVAAVGTAGYYLWLSFAFIILIKVGAEVKVANSLGAKEYDKANSYTFNAIIMALIIAIIYFLCLFFFRSTLINFFNIKQEVVVDMSKNYLSVVAFSLPFGFFIQVVSSIYNASGNSKLPFRTNGLGLITNMILDPLFIFVFDFGVMGAAIATTIAQIFVASMLVFELRRTPPYKNFHIIRKVNKHSIFDMLKIGYAPAIQSALFTIISMIIARFIASFGTAAMAVHRIGTQVEAITYMTASGFGVALSGMVGQNYGAKNSSRINASIKSGFVTMGVYGIFTSLLLIVFARPIFSIFINAEKALEMGVTYLRIIGISQFFMCIEITLGGAFNGVGKSKYPAVVSIGANALRIPLAYYLAFYTLLALDGIWWTISLTTVLKGIVLFVLVLTVLRKFISKEDERWKDEFLE